MKNFKKPLSLRASILLAFLLALICVGIVELIVCSIQAPELYQQLTAPVRACVQQLSGVSQTAWAYCREKTQTAVHDTAGSIKTAFQELADLRLTHKAEEEELQLVDDTSLEPPPRPRASFSVTSLAARKGQEYLTGGTIELIYYNQTAQRWAGQPYGSDHIGGYGCGPTAMAMAVSSLTDTLVDPAQMAEFCVENRYWAKGHGSYHSIVAGVAEAYGLVCASLPPEEASEDLISYYLSRGCLVVALMGKGHFTSRGHFILLRGSALDGSILVADPASTERSLTTWDLELILSELSAKRDNGAPLWVLSAQEL